MIAHLAGRERALEPFGWTGREAEWIALACLHSGIFIRAQWSRFLNAHPEQVRRGVHALVVAVVRTDEELDRADAVLHGWVQPSGAAKSDAGIREEVARIERAILEGKVAVLEEFGGLQAAIRRSVALEKQVRPQPATGVIRRAGTWRTTRLARGLYR
ncbi:MAG: hypothetical protein OXT72_01440 [Gammaproteobacteria bacterium]|nr:hypothetical protein [Gammaproteobacteria bacterium]MDE0246831.1 hypothetical protein [Gammaproteobacteria bacterium]